MAEGSPAPEISAPTGPETARAPARERVLQTFNSVFDRFSSASVPLEQKLARGEALTPEEKKQLSDFKITSKGKELAKDRGGFDHTFRHSQTGNEFTLPEGIPVEGMISFLDGEIARLQTDSPEKTEEIEKLQQERQELFENSVPYAEAHSIDPSSEVHRARTEREAHNIFLGEDLRKTGNQDEDWYLAERTLANRRELKLPEEEAPAAAATGADKFAEELAQLTGAADQNKAEALPPAPQQPGAPGSSETPPAEPPPPPTAPDAPQSEPQTQTEPQQSEPLPETRINVAATSIKHMGREGEREVVEVAAQHQARSFEEERRQEWEGRFRGIDRFFGRLWKNTINTVGLYSKNKSEAFTVMGHGSLQMDKLPTPFLNQLEDIAAQTVRNNRSNAARRVGGWFRDRFNDVTFTRNEMEAERSNLMRMLNEARMYEGERAVGTGRAQNTQLETFIRNNQGVYENYLKVLSGDFQASEAVAEKVADANAQDFLRFQGAQGGGERKGSAVELKQGNIVHQFYANEVMKPLIRAYMENGYNRDAPQYKQALLHVREQVRNHYHRQEYREAYAQLFQGQDPAVFRESMAYGSNLIPMIESTVFTQLEQAKISLGDQQRLTDYVNNVVIDLTPGTMHAGPTMAVGEGWVERRLSRQATLEGYRQWREQNNGRVAPEGTLTLSANSANFLTEVGSRTFPLAFWGTALGVGHAVGQSALRGVTSAGGAVGVGAAAGVVRGAQEFYMLGRDRRQIESRITRGETHAMDARRSQELSAFLYGKRAFTETTSQLRGLQERMATNTATQQDVTKMMAMLADVRARYALMDQRGIDLFHTDSPTHYQTQEKDMQLAVAQTKAKLRAFLKSNTGLTNGLWTQLNLPAGPADKADYLIDNVVNARLTNALSTTMEQGTSLAAQLQNRELEQMATAVTNGRQEYQESHSVVGRDSAFTRFRVYRGLRAGAVAGLTGGLSFWGSHELFQAASQAALENDVPVAAGALKGLGWVKDRVTGSHNVHVPQEQLLGHQDLKFGVPKGWQVFTNGNDVSVIDAQGQSHLYHVSRGLDGIAAGVTPDDPSDRLLANIGADPAAGALNRANIEALYWNPGNLHISDTIELAADYGANPQQDMVESTVRIARFINPQTKEVYPTPMMFIQPDGRLTVATGDIHDLPTPIQDILSHARNAGALHETRYNLTDGFKDMMSSTSSEVQGYTFGKVEVQLQPGEAGQPRFFAMKLDDGTELHGAMRMVNGSPLVEVVEPSLTTDKWAEISQKLAVEGWHTQNFPITPESIMDQSDQFRQFAEQYKMSLEMQRPENVQFHSLWRDFGIHEGHELEMQYPGEGHVKWSGGKIFTGETAPYRKWLSPRFDGALDSFIKKIGHPIDAGDLDYRVRLKVKIPDDLMSQVHGAMSTDESGLVTLRFKPDANMDVKLPEFLVGPDGKPNTDLILEDGFGLQEGDTFHYLNSLRHPGPIQEIAFTRRFLQPPEATDFMPSQDALLTFEESVDEVTAAADVGGLPLIWRRRPLERPEAIDENIDVVPPVYYGGETYTSLKHWLEKNPQLIQTYRRVSEADGRQVWVDKEGKPVERNVGRERAVIQKYLEAIKTKEPGYYQYLEGLSRQGTFKPMTNECRVAVNVPAYEEGKNIRQLLSEYVPQKDAAGNPLDPNSFEINIIVNRRRGTTPDNTVDEINKFITEEQAAGRNPRINYIDVQFDPPYNNVGNARRVVTDLTLLRSLNRTGQTAPLYIESEDADHVRVDQRTVSNLITALDRDPHLDAVRGIQDRMPEELMKNDFLFVNRRMWDFTELLLRREKFRPENNPDWNFTWNRVITGGWNTGYTAEAIALIGGYDPLQTKGEDMTVGEKLSMIRGDGTNPNLDVIGKVATRTDSSPRRFISEIFTGRGAYSDAFEDEDFNRVMKNGTLPELQARISSVARIDATNRGTFEGLLKGHYETIKNLTPNEAEAHKMYDSVMFWLGLNKGDYEYTADGNVQINNLDSMRDSLADYRARHPNPRTSGQRTTSRT